MTPTGWSEPSQASPPENYQRYFVPAIGAPIAEDLIRAAALRPGERVLDVGCGTGVVTRLAAERVGADGTVAGLDVNPGMLAVARAHTPDELDIAWHEASAEAMPLPDEAFDVVLCQMSLQFVPDRAAALREMHRVLVPGGRLLLNLPGPASEFFGTLEEAMERHVGGEAAGFVRAVFSLHENGEIAGLLRDAGFRDVKVEDAEQELRLPAPRDFLWQYVTGTPLAGVVAQADDAARTALERDVVRAWAAYEEGDGMRGRQRMVLARGRK